MRNGEEVMGNMYPFSALREPNITRFNNLASNMVINYEMLKGLRLMVTAAYSSGIGTSETYRPIASRNPLRTLRVKPILEPQKTIPG